jgi:hypothetical protein
MLKASAISAQDHVPLRAHRFVTKRQREGLL